MSVTASAFYAAADIREMDRRAIEELGVPGYTLMQRAARAAWEAAASRWPEIESVVVHCGTGNNGGDGYEVARLAAAAGLAVTVRELPGERRGDAARAREAWLRDGGEVAVEDGRPVAASSSRCLRVDALFGTGLSRPPEGVAAAAIDDMVAAQAAAAPVLALDVPSGLGADRGVAFAPAVVADLTVTFIGDKPGLYTADGPEHAGVVRYADLEVAARVQDGLTPLAQRLHAGLLPAYLPPRRRGAHKGRHGHVLLVGGAPGMPGAALLAGRAALRCGAGLVTVATHPQHAAALAAAQPELMVHGVAEPEALDPLLARATVIALGPGLGQGDWGRWLWQALWQAPQPKVLDADALNLLAASPCRPPAAIITPHPGEAARLLDCDTASLQADRLQAVRRLQARFGGAAVLKGAGSLVAGPPQRPLGLCTAGNPGLAVGGSGDVLTGVTAALLAQRWARAPAADDDGLQRLLFDVACAAVTVHAHAGDLAAAAGQRGMLPGDVIDQLRQAVNPAAGAALDAGGQSAGQSAGPGGGRRGGGMGGRASA